MNLNSIKAEIDIKKNLEKIKLFDKFGTADDEMATAVVSHIVPSLPINNCQPSKSTSV